MKILVTGVNGLLGQHLTELLLSKGQEVVGIGTGPQRYFPGQGAFQYLDASITDQSRMSDVFYYAQPEAVVHAAAITQIDQCQLDQGVCEDVNVKGTANVLLCAEEYKAHFVFLSTDFVFDGERGNYAEDDHQNPISWYGFTKVQAESMVEISDTPWCIVRTCLVYGSTLAGTRSNIITWVKKSLEEGKRIQVVNDQHRTPTYVRDLAKGIEQILTLKATGVYHLSGAETFTPYEMAMRTAYFLNLDESLIESVDASVFTQPARRPPRTGFDISKAQRELDFRPRSFEEGLKDFFL